MTARRFLEKHGLLDAQEYQRRLIEQGNPDAVSVQYPLSELRYRDMGTGQNVLLITVDGLNYSRFEKQMPALAGFAEQNISFTRHMSPATLQTTASLACSMASRRAIWMAFCRPVRLRH